MRVMNLVVSTGIFTLSLMGCSVPDGTTQRNAEIRACGLQDDPSITADVDLHACAPGDTKKTTICHIPPGNPSNAHTLCVGNSAVPAHLGHGDTRDQCANEPPCDPGVDAGTGGGSGSGSGGDGGGDGSGSGSDGGGGVIL